MSEQAQENPLPGIKNKAVIDTRWPNAWAVLSSSKPPESALLLKDSKAFTLIVNGIHVTSCYDHEYEAKVQTDNVPQGGEFAAVYGVGSGAIQRQLLARPEIKKLVVFVMSRTVDFGCMVFFDHSDWLADPRVDFALACQLKEVYGPVTVYPSAMLFADDDCARTRDILLTELLQKSQIQNHSDQRNFYLERIASLQDWFKVDLDVELLRGRYDNKGAICCLGGPTLADQYDWIKENREKNIVVCASTSLLPLLNNGITPNFVMIVDSGEDNLRHFHGICMEWTWLCNLVYMPTIYNKIRESWPGPAWGFYIGEPAMEGIRAEMPRTNLHCGGSVAHPLVDFAVLLGCQDLYLLGADFCFPGSKSHVDGATYKTEIAMAPGRPWVFNGNGEKSPSDFNLVTYLRRLEHYILQHKELRWWKLGKEGATMEGVSWIDSTPQKRLS